MKYIINADDFGRTEYTNKAISEGFAGGYLDRTTLMVNMAGSDEAVELAKQGGFADKVGLHLNLTSWMPLTNDIKKIRAFCDKNGYFNGCIFKSKRVRLFLLPHELFAVRKEIDAQIEKYLQYGFNLKHLDSHGHVHTFPSLYNVCMHEAKKYNFLSIRISKNLSDSGLKMKIKSLINSVYNMYNSKHGCECKYFDSLQVMVANFDKLKKEDGECEIMLHPDYRDKINLQLGNGEVYKDLDMFKEYR